MNNLKWIGISCGLAVVALSGCFKSPYEKATDEMIAAMDKFSELLPTITDEASARAAVPHLEESLKVVRECGDLVKCMQEPPESVRLRVVAKLENQYERHQRQLALFANNIQRVPSIRPIVQHIFDELKNYH